METATEMRRIVDAGQAEKTEPIPSRLYAEGANQRQGANHATKHDHDEFVLNQPGRHQLANKGLTQQATNNPCVAARKDGQSFAAIHEETQADARAEIRRDLASPAETLARRNRMELSETRKKTRLGEMMEARATIRKHGIITAAEFLAQLQNTLAATVDRPGSDLSRYRSMLSELAVAIDDDMQGDA